MCNWGLFLAGVILLAYIACIIGSVTLMLFTFVLGMLLVLGVCSIVLRCLKIEVKLKVPIEISEKDKENLVKVRIHNSGNHAIAKGKVLIVVKDVIRGKASRYWLKLPIIQVGENEFVENIIFPEMGRYELRLKRVRIYDVTGLTYGDVWTKGISRIQVMPEMFQVPVLRTDATRNFYGDAEAFDDRVPGYDHSEIFQVREYQRGDRLQHVHWKLTAKHDELVVKEHSLPKPCPVVLFLEYCPGLFGKRCKGILPFMEAVVGLSFSIMDTGCPHFVVWYDYIQKDVLRIRVEDEESMFYFIGILMNIRFGRCKGGLAQRYREKYRTETYVREFTLNEKLVLKDETSTSQKLSARHLKKSLSEIELIL